MTPFERRTRDAQARLDAAGADALVCFPGVNLRYLTGVSEEPMERPFFLFVPAAGDPVVVVPALSAESVRETAWVDDVRAWTDEEGPDAALDSALSDLGLSGGRLLLDDRLWARFSLDLQARLPDATFGLASDVLGPLRRRKDEAELDALRRAAAAADATMRDVRSLGADALGLTETALADYVEERLAAHGGTGVSFETIVAAGENGAKPHHHPGDREIRAGDPVVLDFGTRVDGYPSDQTRTVVFGGDPSGAFERVHEVVREAQAAGVAAVEPGATTGDVDRAARSVIEDAGYGGAFVHRTGHGVGLDVHEEPYVVAGGETELEPGMVFSVEPGVYVSGEFGVRIEDLVAVRETGCERLNRTDRGWRL